MRTAHLQTIRDLVAITKSVVGTGGYPRSYVQGSR